MNKRNTKVERGRTGSDLPPAMKATQPGIVASSRDEVAHSASRPARVPMSNSKKLEIPESMKEEGFYYRWVQDRDGRVNKALSAYYEHVTDEQGNNYTCNAGLHTLYLMRLQQEYRREDEAKKASEVAKRMDVHARIGPNEYAPDENTGRAEGGQSAISRRIS